MLPVQSLYLLCLVSIRIRGYPSSHRSRGQGGLRQGMWALLEEESEGEGEKGRNGREGEGPQKCVDQIAHKQLIVILRSRRHGLESGIGPGIIFDCLGKGLRCPIRCVSVACSKVQS